MSSPLVSCLLAVLLSNAASMMQSTYRSNMRVRDMRMSSAAVDIPAVVKPEVAIGGSWFAILSIGGHKGNILPVPVEVAGERLVAWNNPLNNEWSVMRDECPHRLAPLSEGRVDPLSGCIECPYHGQQFDGKGKCKLIPQSEVTEFPKLANAHALPVHITGDLLWAYMTLPPGQAAYYPTMPEIMMPELLDAPLFFTRDLPYSFDFLIENFMDPSHVPFAHHSLQGSRDDGSPIPMQMLTTYENSTHLEVAYQDKIKGKAREGAVAFAAPFYYHFRTKNLDTGAWKRNLVAVVMPVAPGRSRIFFELPPLRAMRKKIPTFFVHMMSNKFLDTDIWIHDQERFQRSKRNSFTEIDQNVETVASRVGQKYVLTTESDLGALAWRKWWRKHMYESPLFGEPKGEIPWMTKAEQFDRYDAHAKTCMACKGALTNARTVKKVSPFVALFLAAIAPNKILRILSIALGFFANEVAEKIIKGISGPSIGDITSAAQYPDKKKAKA